MSRIICCIIFLLVFVPVSFAKNSENVNIFCHSNSVCYLPKPKLHGIWTTSKTTNNKIGYIAGIMPYGSVIVVFPKENGEAETGEFDVGLPSDISLALSFLNGLPCNSFFFLPFGRMSGISTLDGENVPGLYTFDDIKHFEKYAFRLENEHLRRKCIALGICIES